MQTKLKALLSASLYFFCLTNLVSTIVCIQLYKLLGLVGDVRTVRQLSGKSAISNIPHKQVIFYQPVFNCCHISFYTMCRLHTRGNIADRGGQQNIIREGPFNTGVAH